MLRGGLPQITGDAKKTVAKSETFSSVGNKSKTITNLKQSRGG
jgi:hypothetical protein